MDKKIIELLEILRDEDNCNVLDYIDEAADLIESLAAELEQVKQERDGLNILLGQAQSMLETRTRERDAAVEEWKQSAIAGKSMCDMCMFSDDEGRCWNDCIDGELWQWRGVKEG